MTSQVELTGQRPKPIGGQRNTGNFVNSWWKASPAETSVSHNDQGVSGG